MFLALLLWKLTFWMALSRSSSLAVAKSLAVLYFWKRAGVTWLTVLSVVWAERMVAMRSWSGVCQMRAVWGLG